MRIEGFPPVFDGNSRVLILGSFPSVKSRREGFYYGNPQNRFWRTVCAFFGEEPPASVAEKRAFLLRRGVALWDVVSSCEIVGSADASIREEQLADVPSLLTGGICAVLCNGATAYSLFCAHFPDFAPMAERLPSTSPANPRFSAEAWNAALGRAFGGEGCAHAHMPAEKSLP